MASYQVIQGRTQDELIDKLNGAYVGAPVPLPTPAGLNGLTLIFTTPSATVTFDGVTYTNLPALIADANSQAAPAAMRMDVVKSYPQGLPVQVRFTFFEGAGGVVISDAGTANELLGLPTSGGSVSGVPIDPTKVITVESGGHSQHWSALVAP